MAINRGTELATIDVALVTIKANDSDDLLALDTASQINVTVNSETSDAVKLIIKGVLKAQKGEETTITGNNIVLTDNVFTPELVVLLQGGNVEYDSETNAFKSYTPPVAGQKANNKPFELVVYSAIYNAAALCIGYEKITYPNCQGQPVALSSQDGTFRVAEYTINSAPDVGEPPYKLEVVKELPEIAQATTMSDMLNLDD